MPRHRPDHMLKFYTKWVALSRGSAMSIWQQAQRMQTYINLNWPFLQIANFEALEGTELRQRTTIQSNNVLISVGTDWVSSKPAKLLKKFCLLCLGQCLELIKCDAQVDLLLQEVVDLTNQLLVVLCLAQGDLNKETLLLWHPCKNVAPHISCSSIGDTGGCNIGHLCSLLQAWHPPFHQPQGSQVLEGFLVDRRCLLMWPSCVPLFCLNLSPFNSNKPIFPKPMWV